MKVLVTGADGFVGKAVCRYLESKSTTVIKLYSLRHINNKTSDDSSTIYADITNQNTLFQISEDNKLDGINTVIHTAGLAHQFKEVSKEAFLKVNVLGTKNVAEFAKKIKAKNFIQISSVSVYGDIKAKELNVAIDEKADCNPQDNYAKSKFEAEKICQKSLESSNTNLAVLRLSTVIGEGDVGNVYRLIKLIDQGKFIWLGDGQNIKSLIYIEDVARFIYLLIPKMKNNFELLNLTAQGVSMQKIVSVISDNLGKKLLRIRIPYRLSKNLLALTNTIISSSKTVAIEKSVDKWVANDYYSGSKFEEKTKNKPVVSVEEALIKEVEWYKNQK